MFGAFVCAGGRPVDACLVVVINWGGCDAVRHVHVGGSIADVKELLDTFVGGQDLGLAGALCGLLLADGLPCGGAAGTAYHVAGERAELE